MDNGNEKTPTGFELVSSHLDAISQFNWTCAQLDSILGRASRSVQKVHALTTCTIQERFLFLRLGIYVDDEVIHQSMLLGQTRPIVYSSQTYDFMYWCLTSSMICNKWIIETRRHRPVSNLLVLIRMPYLNSTKLASSWNRSQVVQVEVRRKSMLVPLAPSSNGFHYCDWKYM